MHGQGWTSPSLPFALRLYSKQPLLSRAPLRYQGAPIFRILLHRASGGDFVRSGDALLYLSYAGIEFQDEDGHRFT